MGLYSVRRWASFAAAAGDRRAVAAAGAATLLLRPRGGLIEPGRRSTPQPTSAPPSSTGPQDFRELQRMLGLAGIARRSGHPRPAALAPAAGCAARAGAPAAAARRRRRRAPAIALVARRRRACRSALWRHERAVDVGLSPSRWPAGSWTSSRRRRSARSTPAIGGLRRRWRWSAASRATGGRPPRCLVVAYGVVTHLPLSGRDRSALQPLRAAAARRAALRRAAARGSRRGGRGRGLPGGRQPADERAQRLRERARPHQARRPLRQPDRGLPARRGARRWSRTSSATQKHNDVLRGLPGSRSWRRPGTFLIQALAERFARGPWTARGTPARRAAGDRARGRARRASASASARQRAVAPGGGARRRVRARADARSRRLHRARAAHRGAELSDPDPPALLPPPVRHASDRPSSGSASARPGRLSRLPRRVAPRTDRAGRPRAGLVRAAVGVRRRAAGRGLARRRAPRARAAATCASRRSAPTAATGGRSGS